MSGLRNVFVHFDTCKSAYHQIVQKLLSDGAQFQVHFRLALKGLAVPSPQHRHF